jgi:hypothetical protein
VYAEKDNRRMKSIEWIEATPSRTLALMGDTQVACISQVDSYSNVSIHVPMQCNTGRFVTEQEAKDYIVEQLENWITEAEEWMKIVK